MSLWGQLEAAGWVIDAALISYVRTVPWAFEDLDWSSARPALQQLHAQSLSKPIGAVSHTFLGVGHSLSRRRGGA
jgi:hypothetical protein